ncbi:MAG: transposase [Bryobacteraceae bacterium]|jgi:hypothetical protein
MVALSGDKAWPLRLRWANKASKETIAKSLEGTWLPEQLAILKRQLVDWDHVQKQMAACDLDLRNLLKQIPAAEGAPAPEPPDTTTGNSTAGKRKRKRKKKASRNEPNFDLAAELKRVAGVDLTRIDGIKVMTVQTIIAEAGLDMGKWPTEDHFVSWIGFAPHNEVSSGKVLNKKTRKVKSRLATALRTAASTLRKSESYLGAQFRRLRTRLGPPRAIAAMGAKLARLVYRMLKYGQEYVDKGTALYEENHRQQQIRLPAKKAAQHGFTLVLSSNPA